jgi:hypothetical protein
MGVGKRGASGGTIVGQTTGDITYYVRTTGSDSNDGLSTGTALATLVAALDKIPALIKHKVLIDMGAGTFTGADITGFIIDQGQTLGGSINTPDASLIISGTLGQPTLTTGTATGTATSGTTSQLVDTGQAWTTNELRGRLVLVDGNYRVVRDNTDDTIEFCAVYGASTSGKAYEILEQKTILNGNVAGYGYAALAIWDTYAVYRRCLIIENIKIDAADAYWGFLAYGVTGFSLSQSWIDKPSGSGGTGLVLQSIMSEFDAIEIYISGNFAEGSIAKYNAGILRNFRAVAKGVSSFGFSFNGVSVDDVEIAAIDCGGAGCYMAETWPIGNLQMNRGYFADNGSHGLQLGSPGALEIANVAGSGNTGYGVYNDSSTRLDIGSGVTVTGTSGDLSIDAGTTTLSWSDLSSVGDVVKNLSTGALVRRK